MVLGHRWRRYNWFPVLPGAQVVLQFQGHDDADAGGTHDPGPDLLAGADAPRADHNTGRRWRWKSGADNQGTQDDHEPETFTRAQFTQVHDTSGSGLSVRVFHQSGIGE